MAPEYPNSLRKYRLKMGLTQEEVYTALGQRSASRLSSWESGDSLPSVEHLIALSELYRVPISKLVGGYATAIRRKRNREDELQRKYEQLAAEQGEMTVEQQVDELARIIVKAYFMKKRGQR